MSDVGLIRNGAVLIRAATVELAGPQDRVARSGVARAAECIDLRGRIVLPGFVDSHTHALFGASRVDEYEARIRGATYSEIAEAGGGIQASARRIRSISEQKLVRRLTGVVGRFVEHGTTLLEIKSGYGLELAQELKMLRAIKKTARRVMVELVPTLLIHDVPARLKARRAVYLRLLVRRLIPVVARRRLAECFDVFCDRGYFSVAEAKTLLEAAAQAGLKLKLHAEQLAHTGAARMAAGLGAISVDHLDHVSDTDIRRLQKHGTIATLLPGSVLYLNSGPYPPARRLIDAGVPVALASNFNPGSSPTLNMQMILALACSQMRMTPAEAIAAATINGAYAVGRGDRAGSLESGKQADLVVMDVDDYREIPYYFGVNHCVMAIKNGKVVFSRGV
jgi:imidazolonepropionase